jgi:hypothetical protein
MISDFARISKVQGYQGLLREKEGSSFGQNRAFCVEARKNVRETGRISLFLGSIKCFPISFNTFKKH